MKRLFVIVLLALGAGGAVRSLLLEGVWVASGSMEPRLPQGNHYFVNKLVYHLRDPKRGEIIVFKSPVDTQKGMIKRVIAVGGDEIELRAKQVILNGQTLSEPYALYTRPRERLVGDNLPPLKVPADHFFVLGDNRDESEDSSVWRNPDSGDRIPFVSRQAIQGKLIIP